MSQPRLASLRGLEVVFTGRFLLGTQSEVERRAKSCGARVNHKRVSDLTRVVVIGSPSGHWKFYTHGIKIEEALRRRRRGQRIYMITEDEFYQLLGGKGLSDQQSLAALSPDEPTPAGVPYREAVRASSGNGSLTIDLDKRDRATKVHHKMCNRLASAVRQAGFEPLSPFGGGPAFDLAWMRDDALWVVEVKSVSTTSERQQIRLGLGQVLDYQTSLRVSGFDVQSVVAISAAPSSDHFIRMCDESDVILCWPDCLHAALSLRPRER